MRALDLCCCAGGASYGLAQTGLFEEIVGVDWLPQPNYPYAFERANALDLSVADLRMFDFIWASPPCQAHTPMKTMPDAKPHECIIEPLRELLKAAGVPWAMENVPEAPLINPVMLCASVFTGRGARYQLWRHRAVETSFPCTGIPCSHVLALPVLGIYGGHVRDRRRREGSTNRGIKDPPRETAEALMGGLDWMTLDELSEAVPEMYSRHVAFEWAKWAGA